MSEPEAEREVSVAEALLSVAAAIESLTEMLVGAIDELAQAVADPELWRNP